MNDIMEGGTCAHLIEGSQRSRDMKQQATTNTSAWSVSVNPQDRDANCLTTDNLERHSQLSSHPTLPDGGALLNEAKLQTIMSFLDEMKRSEQERPSSVTSGSHREVGAWVSAARRNGKVDT